MSSIVEDDRGQAATDPSFPITFIVTAVVSYVGINVLDSVGLKAPTFSPTIDAGITTAILLTVGAVVVVGLRGGLPR